jgi:hypothetical protein
MEPVEFLNQTRVMRDDGLGLKAKPFIFNRALLPSSPKLRMTMSTVLISMGYRGF